jgi:hypothetical protein
MRDFDDVGVLCTFNSIPALAAAAGIARSSQLSSSLSGRGIQYDMARPTQNKSPLHSSPPARQGRTLCWFVSLPSVASVVKTVVSKDDCHQWISLQKYVLSSDMQTFVWSSLMFVLILFFYISFIKAVARWSLAHV